MQVKLLRVLQDLEFEQVGGTKTFKVDTRVILATNEDLGRAVADGRFRQDLYYRVNVINIELPSLRDRIADIPLLAEHFLRQVCAESGKKVGGFSDEAMNVLQRFRWPGNVRELQNVIERAVLLGKSTVIGLDDLPSHLLADSPMAVETAGARGPEGVAGRSGAANHPERAGGEPVEPPGHRRGPRHQPHHALQEDEATGAGRGNDGGSAVTVAAN